MFEKATRLKVRFTTPSGNLAVEDLWDIPLISTRGPSLDDIAKGLNRAVKDGEEESFVAQKSIADTVLGLKFDIVKHVIKVKLAEADANEKAVELKAKKERIMALLADKADEELKGKTAEELTDLLNSM